MAASWSGGSVLAAGNGGVHAEAPRSHLVIFYPCLFFIFHGEKWDEDKMHPGLCKYVSASPIPLFCFYFVGGFLLSFVCLWGSFVVLFLCLFS